MRFNLALFEYVVVCGRILVYLSIMTQKTSELLMQEISVYVQLMHSYILERVAI